MAIYLTALDLGLGRWWTEDQSLQFWVNRPWVFIGRDGSIANRRQEFHMSDNQCEDRERVERENVSMI